MPKENARSRMKITFQINSPISLPINYQYGLIGGIYDDLTRENPEYAKELHDQGFKDRDSLRQYRGFCFSALRCPARRIEGETFIIAGVVEWLISSPKPEFFKNLLAAYFKTGKISLCGQTLPIQNIESLPDPTFEGRASFICLSPITTSRHEDGRKAAHYLRPEEDDFSEKVRNNLVRKTRAILDVDLSEHAMKFAWDRSYIEKRHGKALKLISFKGGQSRILGIEAPFTVEGAPELISMGYALGFGEKIRSVSEWRRSRE